VAGVVAGAVVGDGEPWARAKLLSPSPRPATTNTQPTRFAGRREASTKPTTGTARFGTLSKTSAKFQPVSSEGTRCRSAYANTNAPAISATDTAAAEPATQRVVCTLIPSPSAESAPAVPGGKDPHEILRHLVPSPGPALTAALARPGHRACAGSSCAGSSRELAVARQAGGRAAAVPQAWRPYGEVPAETAQGRDAAAGHPSPGGCPSSAGGGLCLRRPGQRGREPRAAVVFSGVRAGATVSSSTTS